MSFQRTLIHGVLQTVAALNPEYKSLIDFALSHEDQIEKVGPIIKAAAEEGPGAFAAAKKQAPQLAKAIEDFVHSIPGTAGTHAEAAATVQKRTENVTRLLVGLPHMSPDVERAWMDGTTTAQTPTGG